MKRLLVTFLLLFICLFLPSKILAYDPLSIPNNIYGIGVINHSDLEDVSNLVNVNGGDWGYVKVVITEKDRNKEVWQKFLDDCRRLHLIPIIRTATSFDGQNWVIPSTDEIDNWVSFFNSLNWVVENRYVVISNEPNHAKEWGGKINPQEYATYLKTFSQKLKSSNLDYFVLNAGFDQMAPNSKVTMDQKKYIDLMLKETPDVFDYVDGWNSHSYPNPAFSGPKNGFGRNSVRGYLWELDLIDKKLPVFITETGWVRNSKNEQLIAENLRYAYEEIWMKDENIVAVTPFILNYQDEPFYEFSWKNKDGSYYKIYETIQSIQKVKGSPVQKISGDVIFSFLNPLIFDNFEHKGFLAVKNTGQAIWTQSESHVFNESDPLTGSYEIKISNTKFANIEPFKTGLVVYTLSAPDQKGAYPVKLGFYVKGERIGEAYNGKIISF